MLGFEASNLTLPIAFGLGFFAGVITTLRLFGITYDVSQRHLKNSIDHAGSDAVDKGEEGNPP